MYSANLDFMSIPEDITEEDFSTDGESIEVIDDTIRSTSRAVGEATGARPKTTPTNPTVNQTRQKFRENIDQNDDLIEELRERNLKKNEKLTAKAESKIQSERTFQKMRGISREIVRGMAAKKRAMKLKKSIQRAASHQKSEFFNGIPEFERERKKMKIPPLDDDESSVTFYTSDSDSDDSIPSVNWDD